MDCKMELIWSKDCNKDWRVSGESNLLSKSLAHWRYVEITNSGWLSFGL